MDIASKLRLVVAGAWLALLAACGGGGSAPVTHVLTVATAGTGSGSVTSGPAGINCGASCAAGFDDGTSVTLTAAAANGSTFGGWSGACAGGAAQVTVTVDAAKSCTASFAALRALGVSLTGAGSGTVTGNPAGIACGSTCSASHVDGTSVVLTAAPAAGSAFVQWGGDCAGAAVSATVVLSAQRACTARFEPLHTLTVAKAGSGGGTVTGSVGGIDCGTACSADLLVGTNVTLTAVADPGSTFAGWSGGTAAASTCAGTGTCALSGLDQNAAVTATFTLNPAQIQVAATVTSTAANGGGGSVLCSANAGPAAPCGAYPAGTALTLTAIPNGASNFVAWSGASGSAIACSGTTTPCSFTLNAASAVTATFDRPVISVALTGTGGTVTSSPTGISCSSGSTCQQPFDKGTTVTLTASGAGFTGWSGGGCAGTGTCVSVLSTDATVTANFGGAGLPSFALAALEGYVKASNTETGDQFGGSSVGGSSVALEGDTLAVGAWSEDSAATGINGNQASESSQNSGAVYVFTRTGGVWSQQAYLKASNTGAEDGFGFSVALAGDTLAVGAVREDSAATGVNGNQADNSAIQSGAVYVFTRTGGVWSQQAYIKASNTGAGDAFGQSVALEGDTLAVGAWSEDSAATGINGNQLDNSSGGSGAVYVFTRTDGVWSQQAYIKASNTEGGVACSEAA